MRIEVPELVGGDVVRILDEATQRLARPRPGEVHGGERAGHVHDLGVVPHTAFHHSNHAVTASAPVEVVVT